jgi:exosome complex component RRP46
VRHAKEKIDRAHVQVSYKPKIGQAGVEDRARDEFVRATCEAAIMTALHPRTAVQVALQQLDDDGGELACCVNAACLALVDAGIAMKFLFAAVTCVLDKDGNVVLDADKRAESRAACVVTFVFDSAKKDILASHVLGGRCSEKKFQECLGVAISAADKIFDFYRECVKRKFSKEFS